MVYKTFFFYLLFNGQVGSYAIRDAEEYKNFCDRSKDQRPLPEEVIGVRFLDTFRFWFWFHEVLILLVFGLDFEENLNYESLYVSD